MENAAVSALRRELELAQARWTDLLAEVKVVKAQIRDFEAAIKSLGGETSERGVSVSRSRQNGERLEDRVRAEIERAGQTTVSEIVARLAEGGRQTSEPTVSSLVSRLKHAGYVTRGPGGQISWARTSPSVSQAAASQGEA